MLEANIGWKVWEQNGKYQTDLWQRTEFCQWLLFLLKILFHCKNLSERADLMIGCTNYPNVQIHSFRKRFSFIWGCFFHMSILKKIFFCFHFINYLPTALRKNCFVTICQYKVLEIQFWSVNYALVARICKNFEQNMSCW